MHLYLDLSLPSSYSLFLSSLFSLSLFLIFSLSSISLSLLSLLAFSYLQLFFGFMFFPLCIKEWFLYFYIVFRFISWHDTEDLFSTTLFHGCELIHESWLLLASWFSLCVQFCFSLLRYVSNQGSLFYLWVSISASFLRQRHVFRKVMIFYVKKRKRKVNRCVRACLPRLCVYVLFCIVYLENNFVLNGMSIIVTSYVLPCSCIVINRIAQVLKKIFL